MRHFYVLNKNSFRKFKFFTCIFSGFVLMNLFSSEKEVLKKSQSSSDIISSSIHNIDKIDEILSRYEKSLAFFFISGPRIITGIPTCCIISAAVHHPKSAVIAFVHSRMKQPVNWTLYKNIFTLKLDEANLVQNTPLDTWYFNETWRKSQLWDYHLGDALRLAYLWKYGGVYLDTDVIVLRNILELPSNSLAYENDERTAIDGAVLSFDKSHPFINLAMNKFVDEFQDTWAYQGPSLMFRTSEIYKETSLNPVNILDASTFYPISWKNLEIKKIYQAKHLMWSLEKIRNSSAIHLWNKASKKFSIEKGSLMNQIMSEC